MAGPRTLDPDRIALSELVSEARYTVVRVRQSPEARAELPLAERLLADARATLAAEEQLSEVLIEADAAVSLRNLDADGFIAQQRGVLQHKTRGRFEHKLMQRFYPAQSPHEVMRLGLRRKLAVLSPWLESLQHDPDPELRTLSAPLATVLMQGQEAICAQDRARQTMRDFRAKRRAQLFDQVNNGRRTLFAAISATAGAGALATSLFRTTPDRPRKREPTLSEAEAAVAELTWQLQAAQAELTAAQQRQHEQAERAAARTAAERALAEAQSQAKALAARITHLRDAAENLR